MKIRTGFVSNSSSASFVINKNDLSANQIERLLDYPKSDKNEDGWSVTDSGNTINGCTIMDNDAIDDFFIEIGINQDNVNFESF